MASTGGWAPTCGLAFQPWVLWQTVPVVALRLCAGERGEDTQRPLSLRCFGRAGGDRVGLAGLPQVGSDLGAA